MRVEAYGAVSQIYQSNKVANVKKADGAYSQADRIEFSDVAKTYQTAKTAVNNASDIREDKIAQIKAMMAAGTYNISSEAVAEKIVGKLGAIVF
ncbi:MAG: flagellar biosynthesis anti-sigma factor FlgM [Lachnospira sp.]|nr:flagellar biosynthesis anti-sigma factor FlgM [Lachnospira sp.]